MIPGVPITMWCSLYCTGNEAVGDIEVEFDKGNTVSLPLCEQCLETLQNNPSLLLDLRPDAVLELEAQDDLGNT